MAISIPIITEFVDKGIVAAQASFSTFKTKVGEADGAMNKLKAGSGVAFDAIKANAGTLAMGAGAAIAGFAVKAVGDFQDMALAVDEFRNKTNLTLDQSSRWNEYTGDLGIESDAMIKVFDKLGKAANDQIPAFKDLGVEIAFGPDGSTNIEETFLRVIDKLNAIEDPAKRAKLQAELFGKGWMGAAEIINSSSSDIRKSLESVGDAQIIDEEEIRKAKEFREAQDRLSDAIGEVALTLGEALIPAITKAVDALGPFLEALKLIGGTLDEGMAKAIEKAQDMGKSLSDVARELGANDEQSLTYMAQVLGMSLDELYEQLDRDLVPEIYFLEKAWKEGTRAMVDANTAAVDLSDGFVTVEDALKELKGEIDERQAWRNLIDVIDDAKTAAIEAFTEGTPNSLRDSEAALDEARLKVGEYIAEIDSIPEEQKSEFIAMLDTAAVGQIEAMLAYLARAREVQFMPVLPPGMGGIGEIGSGGRPIGEAPISVRPRAATGVVVNVAGSVVTERDLVESVRKGLVNSQRNGNQLVYSNS